MSTPTEPPLQPRDPLEETTGLYDGLCVCDARVGGSITTGRSRLPLWTFVGTLPYDGWAGVVDGWPYIEREYGWNADEMSNFLYHLTQPRKEFARLLLVLADAESRGPSNTRDPWVEQSEARRRVREQLLRCLDALDRAEQAEKEE